MAKGKEERRRNQAGELLQSPDFRAQWVRMPEKDFNRLKPGADLKIVKDEGKFVTFVDRRSEKHPPELKSKSPRRGPPAREPLDRRAIVAAHQSGVPEILLINAMKRRGNGKLPTAGRRKTRNHAVPRRRR